MLHKRHKLRHKLSHKLRHKQATISKTERDYAAAKGYPPTVMGCPVIELSGTEHKVVVTMGRI